MANIMITERCNLKCEYCFANEFVNGKNNKDITIEQLKNILDFILRDGTETQIGLIGGEPLCHPDFSEIIALLKEDVRIQRIIIYTNGIKISQYYRELNSQKIYLLVNCNDLSYNDLLQNSFLESLDIAFANLNGRVILGANFYKLDYNYEYILSLLEKYKSDRLRVSISVPNNLEYNYEPLEYFLEIKPRVFDFFRALMEKGTIPYLDCNIFPSCLVNVKEMQEFAEWGIHNPLSIVKNNMTNCKPVIDIMPDYTAVRCFGLSKYTKVNIREFATISDLKNYYLRTFDAFAINTVSADKCSDCYKHKTMKCSGGCLIYKIDKILNLKNQVMFNEY